MNTLFLCGRVEENSGMKYSKDGKEMVTITIKNGEEVFSILFFATNAHQAVDIAVGSYIACKCTIKSRKVQKKEGNGSFYNLWISGNNLIKINSTTTSSSQDDECNDIPF